MSYFDDASLVMIPSGYKTSKVYSVKPTDGSGDLTFSRSNDTATRVNSAGLIEKVRTNQFTYSNDFTNAAWVKLNATITAGQAGYDGTNNASLLATTAQFAGIQQVKATSGSNSFSVYAKAGTFGWMFIELNSGVGSWFNLSAGSVGITNNGSASIQSVGNGWYRCSVAGNATTSGATIFPQESNGTFTSNSGNILIQAAQLETGDIATDYIATTTAAVSVGPVANVPRLDYLNSSCPRLLLEPQRTNLRTSSEQFSSLSPSNVTVTSNDTTSPDGYTNADKLTPSGSGFHTIGNSISVTAGQKYTISVFYKYGTHKNIGFYDNNTAGSEITINMETNAFTLGPNVDAGGVVPYGNGWYRAYATFTAGSSDMVNYIIFRDNTNNGNYTGNGSYSWFYGWQVELGAYATSYIPTLGAAVTRGADAALTASVPSLIGQTAGTIFWQGSIDARAAGDGHALALSGSDSSFGDAILLYRQSSNNHLAIYIQIAGANQFGTPLTYNDSASVSENDKYAIAYAANDLVVYKNGVQIISASSGNIPATNFFLLNEWNNTYVNTNITKQAILFPTRLQNSDLAALTA